MQRVDLEVAVEHGSVIGQHRGVLKGDRHAVGETHPLDAHDVGTVRQAQVGDLFRAGRVDAGRHEPRRRRHAAPRHLLGERQENAGAAVHRTGRDERAPTPLAIDQAGDRELLDRLPNRHPADLEAGAQLGLRRQGIAGRRGGDQLAQVGLDVAIAGAAR